MRLASARARTTPPTSGDTTITLARSSRSVMSRTITGAANRLSVGMSKKPWIWPACRSTVSTRSAPARVIRLATSLAEIGVRGPCLAVLPGVAEIGQHGGDAAGRGAAQRVRHDQQFHQVVVGRIGRRLDDEGVLAAHVLLDLDEDLHVGEAAHLALGQRHAEIGGDRLGQAGGLELPARILIVPAMQSLLRCVRAEERSRRGPLEAVLKSWRRGTLRAVGRAKQKADSRPSRPKFMQ